MSLMQGRTPDGDNKSIKVDSSGAIIQNPLAPSSYDTDLTMNGTAQAVALASGVEKVEFINRGATTEAIRVAFGTSAANAQANLGITTGAATTGRYIPSPADGKGEVVLGVPANATHYAVANAVASDTQIVSIIQGV